MKTRSNSKELKVRDVMVTKVRRAKGATPLTTCAKIMLSYNVGSILIDSDKILTKTDIMRTIGEGDLGLITANEVASSPLITCSPEDTLENIMLKMSQKKIEKLVVIEEDEIAGIITTMDVLRTAPGLFEIKRQEWLLSNSKSSEMPEQEIEGYCENCNNYEPVLLVDNGSLVCRVCLEEREAEK